MSHWWLDKPMRLVQTNLREIDATLDVDALFGGLREFSANVLLFNVGGIVANYPTGIECHFPNPYLQGDLVGEVTERCREEGIRFIARYDFSKVNHEYARNNLEWLYVGTSGNTVDYNGQVHTCINGPYQQKHSLRILEESIGRYPIDGVFFNMIGYVTTDYSGTYHGICQCDNCRARFRDFCGEELPTEENADNPVYVRYNEFRRVTSAELFHSIHHCIKSQSEEIAICTFTHEGVDVFRTESNNSIFRPQPEWAFSASETTKRNSVSWPGIVSSNALVHFIDFGFRHAAVAPPITLARLAQEAAQMGWLDFYVIGHLDNQDDRACFAGAKELFAFHKLNEEEFVGTASTATACLISPDSNGIFGAMEEFHGLYRMFTELHICFDVLADEVLAGSNAMDRLAQYQLLIVPDMRVLGCDAERVLSGYVERGGRLLVTGLTGTCDESGQQTGSFSLTCAGVGSVERVIEKQQGAYLRLRESDKDVLTGFEDVDLVPLHGEMLVCKPESGAKALLGYIPPGMFGPPEKCFYTEETDVPGLIVNGYGKGACALFPWHIGAQYERFSTHHQPMLVSAVVGSALGYAPTVELQNAPPHLEVAAFSRANGTRHVVTMVNLSGQLGPATHAPIEMRDVAVTMHNGRKPASVKCLWSGENIAFEFDGDGVSFVVPAIGRLEMAVVSY